MKSRLLGAACTCLIILSFNAIAAVLPLESRLGGLSYYDPNLDITWATNVDIYGDTDGLIEFDAAETLVAGLNIGGVTGWYLPSLDVNGNGMVVDRFGGGVAGCTDNELRFLYWEEGITFAAPSPFSVVDVYWSSTVGPSDPEDRWVFSLTSGHQVAIRKFGPLLGLWPVYSGDASAVPVPAAAWLFIQQRADWRIQTQESLNSRKYRY